MISNDMKELTFLLDKCILIVLADKPQGFRKHPESSRLANTTATCQRRGRYTTGRKTQSGPG
jgi:hypothetical protein